MEQQWQKYYQLGQEAQQSSNFVLAFYLKTYACELAVPYHKTLKQQNDPEAGKVSQMLTQTFNELDSMKVQNPNLKNKEQCKQQITAYIQQNIAQVQQSLNQGSYTPQNKLILEKNIAYIDCLHQNGQLPSDLNNLKNVAQQKLVQFNNKPQNNNYDDFGVPDEGGAVRVNQSNISMQNNQQFLNNNSPNNNALNPSQQDAYYQEAFSKLSASKINDMDNKAIQRILEVSNALNQIDNQQNVPQRMPSKINQSQRIKSIYHPPNNDTFNGKNGLPQNDENINQNNGFGMDNNFGTPNPDLLQQSNLKKLNDQQSGGQLYSNINNNNLNQPPSQETGNNYFFKNSQPQNQSQIKPQQPAGIDNFGTPNPDQPFGQWNAPPLPAQNNVQPSTYNNNNNNNNFQQPQQPSSFNNNNFNNYNNNVQPSSFNNNNNNNFNNNNYQPSNFNNNNNNPYPFVGQQQPPKQPSVYQQPPPPVVVPQQQQQNKIPEPAPAQTKSYPMTGQKKSNGLIKVQAKKLCEQTVQQMKSGSVEQVKKNLTEAIKLLEEVNL